MTQELFRTFIAITLSSEEREKISQLIKTLTVNENFKDLKWVKLDNLHLTLHFSGNISKSQIDNIIPALNNLTDAFQSVTLNATALKLFPNKNHPKTLALEYDVPKSIQEVHETIKQLLLRQNVPVEIRPLRLHLSLAKVQPKIGNFPELDIDLSLYQLSAKDIHLYHSTRDETGLIYMKIC